MWKPYKLYKLWNGLLDCGNSIKCINCGMACLLEQATNRDVFKVTEYINLRAIEWAQNL